MLINAKLRRRERTDANCPANKSKYWVEWQIVIGRKVVYRAFSEKEARRIADETGVILRAVQ